MIVFLSTTPAWQRTMTFAKLQIDAVNRATEVFEYASGKNINAARVARTIREDVLATGFLGGHRGQQIRDDLDRAGIAHDFIDVAPETRLCTTAVDRAAGTATELLEESGEASVDDGDRLLALLSDLLPDCDVLVLSGRLAAGVGQNFYARCVGLARRRDVPVIVDTVGEALKMALAERPTIIKPNRPELAATVGAPIENEAQLRDAILQLTSQSGCWVVVTGGAAPTIVSHGAAFHEIATPHVQVINPIGSGDALAAGLAAGLRRGMDVPMAARLGVACGAANAMTPLAGHVDPLVVEELCDQLLKPKARMTNDESSPKSE